MADIGDSLWKKWICWSLQFFRINGQILSWFITCVAFLFNGTAALRVAEKRGKLQKFESCEETSPPTVVDFESYDAAHKAVEYFWVKSEDKVRELIIKGSSKRTKKLLLCAVEEGYNRLLLKLKEDLAFGNEMNGCFAKWNEYKKAKMLEFRAEMQRSEYGDTNEVRFRSNSTLPTKSISSLETNFQSVLNAMSSIEMSPSNLSPSVDEMIPLLREVKREISTMLEYLIATKTTLRLSREMARISTEH